MSTLRKTIGVVGSILTIVAASILLTCCLTCAGCFQYGDVGPYPWWMEPGNTFPLLVAIGIVIVALAYWRKTK